MFLRSFVELHMSQKLVCELNGETSSASICRREPCLSRHRDFCCINSTFAGGETKKTKKTVQVQASEKKKNVLLKTRGGLQVHKI